MERQEDKSMELTRVPAGNYTPPDCVSSSNSVMMNFTVLSKGTQFDRLAIM